MIFFQRPIHSAISQTHDNMTRLQGSHKKSSDAIVRLSNSGAMVVAVVVLTKHNIKDIASTFNYIQELGISQISVDRYNIGGKSLDNLDEILPNALELKSAHLIINVITKQNGLSVS